MENKVHSYWSLTILFSVFFINKSCSFSYADTEKKLHRINIFDIINPNQSDARANMTFEYSMDVSVYEASPQTVAKPNSNDTCHNVSIYDVQPSKELAAKDQFGTQHEGERFNENTGTAAETQFLKVLCGGSAKSVRVNMEGYNTIQDVNRSKKVQSGEGLAFLSRHKRDEATKSHRERIRNKNASMKHHRGKSVSISSFISYRYESLNSPILSLLIAIPIKYHV